MTVDLEKSIPSSKLVWLTFTSTSMHCGKYEKIRRLIEFDPKTYRIIYMFPVVRKKTLPPDTHTQGRPWARPSTNLLQDENFINALNHAGIIPQGYKVS